MEDKNQIPPDSEVSNPPDSVPPYNGPERRQNNMHAENKARLDMLEERTTKLEALVAEGNADTKTLLEIVSGARIGIKMGISLARAVNIFAKWVIPIVTLGGIIWAAMHGKLPGGE